MGALVSLEAALADRRVFRGGQPLARGQGATPSGFAALDEALPWGGFPRGALTEILLPAPGLGELELLSHAWTRIGEQERLAFIAPPCIPYAPALLRAKWPLARFAWIEAPAAQAAWAAEQCLRAGCLGAVAFWLNGGDDRGLRRLQLAAEEGSVHAFLFRPVRHAANASPAALRLVLEAAPGKLQVRVLKVRGAVAPARSLQRERLPTPPAPRHLAPPRAAGTHDAARHDVGMHDAARHDVGMHDAARHHVGMHDAARHDAGMHDAMRHDAARHDAGVHDAVRHDAVRHDAVRHDTARHDTARHDAGVRHDNARHNAVRHNAVRHDAVRHVLHDAGSARTARAYRTLRALLASRNLRAAVAARRAPTV